MLEQGPTSANLRALWGEGVLPPYAVLLYPGTDFGNIPIPENLQAELVQYLIDHPELLIDTPPELAAIIAGLPTDVITDIEVERRMEQLRRAGLLTGPNPGGTYEEWIRNTVVNGVSAATVIDIADDHGITPDSFGVLDGLQRIEDADGKSFFMLDTDMSADAARNAVLMTYIFNAGTGYENGDFAPTPYSSEEVQRIIDRQADNAWFSYEQDVAFVHDNGGRLVTTPNGMLMGLGGNELQDVFSQAGGSTWGEIFMINEDDVEDPAERLEAIIEQGTAPGSELDLDQLLHHEEIHSQQWADHGYAGFIATYANESYDVVWVDIDGDFNPFPVPVLVHRDGCGNSIEEDAGLEDGGYEACG